MDAMRLRKLRIMQFVLVNLLLLTAALLFTFIIHAYSLAAFQRTIGVLILILAVLNIVSKTVQYNLLGLFPPMRELMNYEAEKLGHEFSKVRWTQVIAQFLVAGLMIFQSFLQHVPPAPFSLRETMIFTIPIIAVAAIATNLSLMYHVRKIDRGTTESLKGHSARSIAVGFAIGIPLGIAMLLVPIFIVLLISD
ncbi:hypothetical protein [Paenibacillus piri]|uniref:Uncharacterized protein n=1 Tax=Paenibacillus piri TaxID=2547395 RepID=A0A4R5KL92_9BACL|nr:hypothetical protein [Paenibacillus piri]TDF96343.1 hypothetical protein E1757_18360 [Paenibacillus piri]